MTHSTTMDCQSMASMPAARQRAAPLDLACAASYAQKLNNSAALCIEYGQYQRAEASLKKALQLSRMHIEQKSPEMKPSRYYHRTTIDRCIQFTEAQHPPGNEPTSDRTMTSAFVYRRPIQVPPLQASEDSCSAGEVFSIVVVFNLGLTMQLRAEEKQGEHGGRVCLQKALRLYEIAYKFLHQYYSTGGRSAAIQHEGEIQFRMILCNNLYQLYRQEQLGNSRNLFPHQDVQTRMQQQKYLEELLSTLMYIVERKDGDQTNSDEENERSTSSHFTDPQMRFVDLEGFWKTVEHLVLSSNCADTA